MWRAKLIRKMLFLMVKEFYRRFLDSSLKLTHKVYQELLSAHQTSPVSSVIITSNICGLTSPPSTAEGEQSGLSLSQSLPPTICIPSCIADKWEIRNINYSSKQVWPCRTFNYTLNINSWGLFHTSIRLC